MISLAVMQVYGIIIIKGGGEEGGERDPVFGSNIYIRCTRDRELCGCDCLPPQS